MVICMYTCNNCNKQFKTTQHLNHHKNRKKSCNKVINNSDNVDVSNSPSSLVRKSLNRDDFINYFEELEAEKNKLEAEKNKLKTENAILTSQVNLINMAIQIANLKIKKTDNPLLDDSLDQAKLELIVKDMVYKGDGHIKYNKPIIGDKSCNDKCAPVSEVAPLHSDTNKGGIK